MPLVDGAEVAVQARRRPPTTRRLLEPRVERRGRSRSAQRWRRGARRRICSATNTRAGSPPCSGRAHVPSGITFLTVYHVVGERRGGLQATAGADAAPSRGSPAGRQPRPSRARRADEHRCPTAGERIDERELRALVGGGEREDVGALERSRGEQPRNRLALDPPSTPKGAATMRLAERATAVAASTRASRPASRFQRSCTRAALSASARTALLTRGRSSPARR